jgi:hypothetical protein
MSAPQSLMRAEKITNQNSALIAALTILILFMRAPDRVMHGFLWAEDSTEFMMGSYTSGFRSILHPYGGYLHLLPRLIAISQHAIISTYAAPYYFAGWSMALSIAASMYVNRVASEFDWERCPGFMAGSVALAQWVVPHGGEVFMNITNLQWILAPAFMALLWETICTDRYREAPSLRTLALAILSTTGPIGVFALPVVAAGLLARRALEPGRLLLVAVYVTGCTVQLITFAAHREPIPGNDLNWVYEWTNHLIAALVLPASALSAHDLTSITIAGVVLFIGTVIVKIPARWILISMLFVATVTWLGGMARTPRTAVSINWIGAAPRYTYLTSILLGWCALFAIGMGKSQSMVSAGAVLCVALLANSASHFSVADNIEWRVSRTDTGWSIYSAPGWQAELPPN